VPLPRLIGRERVFFFFFLFHFLLFLKRCPPTPDMTAGYLWPIYRDMQIYFGLAGGVIDSSFASNSDFYDAESTLSPDGTSIVFTRSESPCLFGFVSPLLNFLSFLKKCARWRFGAVHCSSGRQQPAAHDVRSGIRRRRILLAQWKGLPFVVVVIVLLTVFFVKRCCAGARIVLRAAI
jgi:hypothetical protein